MDSDTNQTQETDTESSFLERFVGDGKKYKNVDELAKAYAHLEIHANQLKQEKKEVETTVEVLKDMVEKNKLAAGDEAHNKNDHVVEAKPTGNDEDLDAKVSTIIAKEREKEKAERNLAQVDERLVELYGDTDKAKTEIQARAKELNVSVAWLIDTAKRSPEAFFVAMGLNNTQAPNAGKASVKSNVNTAALEKDNAQGTKIKPDTYAYYQKMRKENPDLYWSNKTQLEMHRKAQEKGEAFFA